MIGGELDALRRCIRMTLRGFYLRILVFRGMNTT
jgi:hypothetical protein